PQLERRRRLVPDLVRHREERLQPGLDARIAQIGGFELRRVWGVLTGPVQARENPPVRNLGGTQGEAQSAVCILVLLPRAHAVQFTQRGRYRLRIGSGDGENAPLADQIRPCPNDGRPFLSRQRGIECLADLAGQVQPAISTLTFPAELRRTERFLLRAY